MRTKSEKAFDTAAIAIAKYIETMGGTAVVIGGVAIGQDLDALKNNYYIRFNITGKKPTKRNV